MPKISVVIPVYNVEKYIRECVESVLSQTLSDIEVILVDDGSPDNSGKILDEYATKDPRVRVIHKANGGVSAARNDGLKECTGDYIYIMDSDDYLEPDALEMMYTNGIETEADVIISDHYTFKKYDEQNANHFFAKEFVTEDREIIQKIQEMVLHLGYSPYLTEENKGLGIGAPWTKLLKSSLVLDNNLQFDSYVQGIFDDGLFALDVFEHAKKVSYIRKYSYHYRILQSSLIHRFNTNRLEIDKKVFEKIREFQNTYNKDAQFQRAYYAKVVQYLVHAYGVYFFHSDYPGTTSNNYKEFISTMKSYPYDEAINKVDISKLKVKPVQRYVVILSRMHFNWAIWIAFKIKKIMNGKKEITKL